jgi:hypothetical protein
MKTTVEFEFLCVLCGCSFACLAVKGFSCFDEQKLLIAKCAKKCRKGRKEIQIQRPRWGTRPTIEFCMFCIEILHCTLPRHRQDNTKACS